MKKVILVYDINTEDKSGQKRLNKIRKIARKYLHHVQKSVFEGELTDGEIANLSEEIKNVVNAIKDFVLLYVFPPSINFSRIFLTDSSDPTSNII